MNSPLISIVLRTYKRTDKLKRCIENILSQEYENWELVIVDDNGLNSNYKGQAKEIINQFRAIKNPINFFEHQQNLGPCAAGNTGINKSNGEYIAFIDDDDIWHPKKLKLQIEKMHKDKLGIGICGLTCIDLTNNSKNNVAFNFEENLFLSLLKKGSGVNQSVTIFRKEILTKIKGFDTNLASYTDFDLLLRASIISKHSEIKAPLVEYYVDSDGISRNYQSKFSGKKIVLEKYKSFYKKYKLMPFYSNHIEVLGDYALLCNYKFEAIKCYLKSIFINPFTFKKYIKIIVTILGGRNLYKYINKKINKINI